MEPPSEPAPRGGGREQRTICFDCSKREIFTPSSGLKALRRRLQSAYRVTACAARPDGRFTPRSRPSHGCEPSIRAPTLTPLSLPNLRPQLSPRTPTRSNKDAITLERLREASLWMITGPRDMFTGAEVCAPPSRRAPPRSIGSRGAQPAHRRGAVWRDEGVRAGGRLGADLAGRGR